MQVVNVLGWIFAALLAAIAALAVVVGFNSIPDIQRYFKIRQM